MIKINDAATNEDWERLRRAAEGADLTDEVEQRRKTLLAQEAHITAAMSREAHSLLHAHSETWSAAPSEDGYRVPPEQEYLVRGEQFLLRRAVERAENKLGRIDSIVHPAKWDEAHAELARVIIKLRICDSLLDDRELTFEAVAQRSQGDARLEDIPVDVLKAMYGASVYEYEKTFHLMKKP